MAKQQMSELYQIIEKKRKELKKRWVFLRENHGDKIEIENLGHELTKLTFNQCHLLIDLEWLQDESN